jgi:ATP-dependent helicase HrpB
MPSALNSLPALPVRAVLPDVARALGANRPVVLQAPPGSGKTLLVAPSLLNAPWLQGRRILLLEPRRLAARAAARYMARLLGEEVGGRVGYQVRLERRTSAATRIEILTEGLLVQRLLNDPGLADTGAIIFDEFHERNLPSDLSLALTLDMRAVLRPDLRVVIMSATLDAVPVARHLGSDAAVITAEARTWPIETRYLDRPSGDRPVPLQVAHAVQRALAEHAEGGILAFLPGEGEIRRAARLLGEMRLPAHVDLHPLFGALPRQAQDAAVEPALPGRRKVVLATSIAESSLTIQDIRLVIDCGWMRVPRFSVRNGMSRLETLRITRDRADQRRGRAGRVAPGFCYRLWDEGADHQLAPRALPEMLDADLAPLRLQCADWGCRDRERLPWLTPPPDAAWRLATELLQELGALDAAERLTAHGRELARLPVHPRLAHMILRGAAAGCARQACLMAAAVEEASGEAAARREIDAQCLLNRLGGAERAPSGDDWARRVHLLANQWGRRYPAQDRKTVEAGRLLSWAFPDRVAQRREQTGQFIMVNGHGALLEPSEALASESWLAVAELQESGADARIRLAARLDRGTIEQDFAALVRTEARVEWNRREERVTALRRRRLGALVMGEGSLPEPPAEGVVQALLEGIRSKGIANLGWTETTRNLQARLLFLRRVCPTDDWPDVTDNALEARLEEWLGGWLDGVTRWEQVRRIDLCAPLMAWIGHRQRQLDELAPTHWRLPSGARAPIRYDQGEQPVLSARLQDLFGVTATPRLADGRVAVVIHLLSPARRPIAVTSDLASFWLNGYPLVRPHRFLELVTEVRKRYFIALPQGPCDCEGSGATVPVGLSGGAELGFRPAARFSMRSTKMTLKHGWMAVACVAGIGLHAQAQEAAQGATLEKSLALGVTLTDGNSETMLANGSLLLAGEKEKLGTFKVGLEGNYGENTTRTVVDGVEVKTDERTVSNAKLWGNVNKTLTTMTYGYLGGTLVNDDIAEIDYRATFGPGVGLYLIKNDSTAFSVEGGLAYVWEEVADIEDDYLALRLAESFEYMFAENSKIWQSLAYMPDVEDFDNYLITAEVGVEAPLQGKLNLRVVLQDKYDSQPGEGLDKNDLTLIAGIGIKL